MNLVIDVGNTFTKIAIFDKKEIVYNNKITSIDVSTLKVILAMFPQIKSAILSSVVTNTIGAELFLESVFDDKFIKFNSETPTRVINLYKTPLTLGADRLAAAEGALELFGSNVVIMVVDLGSAITIDLVEYGKYLGGNISPGAVLRFKALNNFTARLPLCELTEDISLFGGTTNEAIVNGVTNSILFEIERYIAILNDKYGDVKIIFTGGDANYFANKLKNTIFAYSELVLFGLNKVLTDGYQ